MHAKMAAKVVVSKTPSTLNSFLRRPNPFYKFIEQAEVGQERVSLTK